MVLNGREACFMKDKKGYLPAHVACSRHCSPEKLHMLLKINRAALTAKTNSGDTLLSLAIKSATRSHPNYALIDDLKRRLDDIGLTNEDGDVSLLLDEEARRVSKFERLDGRHRRSSHLLDAPERPLPITTSVDLAFATASSSSSSSSEEASLEESEEEPSFPVDSKTVSRLPTVSPMMRVPRKRKVATEDDDMDPATLLLHFSRYTDKKKIKLIASV